MPEERLSSGNRRRGRRWHFAACTLDENNWDLSVDGHRVPIETKPLELLHELLLHAGSVVSKDELLNKVWADVTVVEASLPTAVHKLRAALGEGPRQRCVVETVPGIGYRLGVPARCTARPAGNAHRGTVETQAADMAPVIAIRPSHRWTRPQKIFGAAAGLAVAGVLSAFAVSPHPVGPVQPAFTQRDAANALRQLDVGKVEDLLAAGWDPNTAFDDQGNGALNVVLNKCEWDRGHDREQMVLMVRTLIDGGARLDHRNVWGDTPYSIAKAVRYCGPEHPVTRSIRTMCYAGYKPLGDRCLASYELAATKPHADRPLRTLNGS